MHGSTKEVRSRGALKVERWRPESTCFSALIPISRHKSLTSLLFSFTVSLNLMKNATPLSHPELPRLQILNYKCCPQNWSMSIKWCTRHETVENFILFVGLCSSFYHILSSLKMLTWKSIVHTSDIPDELCYMTPCSVQQTNCTENSVNALIPVFKCANLMDIGYLMVPLEASVSLED